MTDDCVNNVLLLITVRANKVLIQTGSSRISLNCSSEVRRDAQLSRVGINVMSWKKKIK